MNLGGWLDEAGRRLQAHGETAKLEAQVLLAAMLEKPRAWVMAHPEADLPPVKSTALEQALVQLENGEPLPYLLGHWEFYGLDFLISPAVLIPRPETEQLVELGLKRLEKVTASHSPKTPTLVADVGTGSGCIAISLAVQVPHLHTIAIDRSWAALEVARQNSLRHHTEERIQLVASDLLTCIQPARIFDLVCANLPYIPSERLPGLAVYGREPASALDGGKRGLQVLRRLIHQSRPHLAPGGVLLLEIDATQGEAIRDLGRQTFPGARIDIHPDLAGHDRVASIFLPE